MPEPDFDPLDGLSEEDKQYISGHREAFQRQAAAHGRANAVDEERKRAAEEHMRATQQASGVPVTPPPANGTTPASAPRPVAAVMASGRLSIMVARSDTKNGMEIPASGDKYAPDWASLKEMIAKWDGTWTVSRHEFQAQVADILGFFDKDGWKKPEASEKETFEAIVKNGRVFRSDPE